MGFNEDQPRDDHGRWGSGGSGASKDVKVNQGGKRAKLKEALENIKSGSPFADKDAPRRHPEDPKDRAEIEKASKMAQDIAKDWQEKLEPHGVKVVLGGSLISGLSLPGEAHDMDIRFLSDHHDRKSLIPKIEEVTGLKLRKEIQIGPGDHQDSKAQMIEGFIHKDGITLEAEGALRAGANYEGWAKHYKDVLTPTELSIARAKKAELASTEKGRKSKEYKEYKGKLLKEVMTRVGAKRAKEAAEATKNAKRTGDHDKAREAHLEAAKAVGASTFKTTEEAYKRNGEWTKERKAIHEEYTNHATKGVPTTSAPTVYMTGGGPASGKTTGLLRNPDTKIPGRDKAAHINPDESKEFIPEYNEKRAAGDVGAAQYAHEESSHMAKQSVQAALRNGHDVVYDSVGNSGIGKLSKKVQEMRDAGAKRVVAHYAIVDPEEAVRRADERAKNPKSESYGRYVDPDYIRQAHTDVSRTSVAAIESGVFDAVDLYDTSGKQPKHVASYTREGGLQIKDAAAWNLHKARGGVK